MKTIVRYAYLLTLGTVIAVLPARFEAHPSVYPTGTTIYDPEKTWSGYIVFNLPDNQGAILIDMNGNELRRWPEIGTTGPSRVLPGGHIIGTDKPRRPTQEALEIKQLDWDGNEVWRFDRLEQVLYKEDPEDETDAGEMVWAARQHHDWQREGDPVGYYSPEATAKLDKARTTLLTHKNVINPLISDRRLEDDYIVEVSWDGKITWEWLASDHVDELGFSDEARRAIHKANNWNEDRQSYDWIHINAMCYVGPNKWYDEGDERFHPDNIIISARTGNFIAIIARDGSIAWRMGPDYRVSEAWSELGQIIGQHHPHIIPKGLPGAGNLLVFDNGGSAGYGEGTPGAPNGSDVIARDYSRVVEFNPITFEKVWEYRKPRQLRTQFFSHYISAAQRLPNGNTMITEGSSGRAFEVTTDNEIVWEYVTPYDSEENPDNHTIYRAYRIPYEWVPQLEKPQELAVIPPARKDFRIPPQAAEAITE